MSFVVQMVLSSPQIPLAFVPGIKCWQFARHPDCGVLCVIVGSFLQNSRLRWGDGPTRTPCTHGEISRGTNPTRDFKKNNNKKTKKNTAGDFSFITQLLVYCEISEHTEECAISVTILPLLPLVFMLNSDSNVNGTAWHTNSTDLGQLIVTFSKCVCMPTLKSS